MKKEYWLFQNGEPSDPYYGCYRIPAIITLDNGERLIFCEGRDPDCSDEAFNVDIVMRKIGINGELGDIMLVASHRNLEDGNNPLGFLVTRNPSPVLHGGKIYLMYNVNYDYNHNMNIAVPEWQISLDNHDQTQDCRAAIFMIYSSDNGNTWSNPRKIDEFVHPFAGNSTYKNNLWGWYAILPGHALALENGSLCFPANHSEYAYGLSTELKVHSAYSHCILYNPITDVFSLSKPVGADTSEAMAVQLDNGWIYLNMRNTYRTVDQKVRAVTFSNDEGATWMGNLYDYRPLDPYNYRKNVGYDQVLIDPICQGSIIRYSSSRDKRGISRLLLSNPANTEKRINGTIRISYDEGKTWKYSYDYNLNSAGYSDLCIMNNGVICIVYETLDSKNIKGISCIEIDLEKISDNEDSNIETLYNIQIDQPTNNLELLNDYNQNPNNHDIFTIMFTVLFNNLQNNEIVIVKGLQEENTGEIGSGYRLTIKNEEGLTKFELILKDNTGGKEFVRAYAESSYTFIDEAKHTFTIELNKNNNVITLSINGKHKVVFNQLTILQLRDLQSIEPTESLFLTQTHQSGLFYSFKTFNLALSNAMLNLYCISEQKDYNYQDFFTEDFSDFWESNKKS